MNEDIFKVGAKDVDSDKLEKDLRAEVASKESRGVYAEGAMGRISRSDLRKIARDGNLLRTYLDAMRENVFVDITDFEISERRTFMPGLMVSFKKFIWNTLRFYTYRLWSQQNEINGLLMSSLETMDSDARDRIKELEQRVERLEQSKATNQIAETEDEGIPVAGLDEAGETGVSPSTGSGQAAPGHST